MSTTYMTIAQAATRVKRDRDTVDDWAKEPVVDGVPHLKIIWIHGTRYVDVANLLEVARHFDTAVPTSERISQ